MREKMVTEPIFTRAYLLVFLAQFLSSVVHHMFTPTLPIHLSKLGSNEVEIGLLIGTLGISALIVRPFVGNGLLYISEKRFMLAGSFLFVLVCVAYLFVPPFWPFFAARVSQGIGAAFFHTASVTAVANMTPESRRGQSLSYFFLSYNLALVLAPTFGMSLMNHFGSRILFLTSVGLSLATLLTLTNLEARDMDLVPPSPSGKNSLFSLIVLPPFVTYFLSHILWGALLAFFPLYSIRNGVTNPGFFFAVYAVFLILGRALGGRLLDLYSRDKIILPCLLASILGMTILAFSHTLAMFTVVAVVLATGSAFLNPCLMAYALDLSGSSRGPAMGTLTAVGDLGMGLGPVLMGIVLRLTDFRTMFFCLAVIGLLNFGYFYVWGRKR